MLDNGKISSFQMAFMLYPLIVATGILLVPSFTSRLAGQDMWMSPIIASSIGFFIIFILTRLQKRYPKESLVQYSVHILGFWPGKIVGFFFLFHFLHLTSVVVREYGEFLVGSFLPRTPLFAIMATMLLVCNYSIRGGIETIARISQFVIPITILLKLILAMFIIPELDAARMFPVLENGWLPVLKASILQQGWFSAVVLSTFILPSLKDPWKAKRWGLIAVIAGMTVLLMASFIVLFFLGDSAGDSLYPFLIAARYIHVSEFLENTEVIIMANWVMELFIQINVYFYGTALGFAQLFNLKDFRTLVTPLSFLILVFGLWSAPNLTVLSNFLATTYPFIGITIRFLVPLLLLIVAWFRWNSWKKSASETTT